MSRSGYTDDYDNNWRLIMWRGQVASAIRGKRGQSMLKDLLTALDAMPEKRLISNDLVNSEGEVCAIGALGKSRGIDMATIDPEDPDQVSAVFNIAPQLACEIAYENDEGRWRTETPEERYQRMRDWVVSNIARR
jgi:hypothetical protein